MNDSFVDFDMLGVVDPVTLELVRPSLYSETVWEARKAARPARAADRLGGAAQPPGPSRGAQPPARGRAGGDAGRRVGFRASPACATG